MCAARLIKRALPLLIGLSLVGTKTAIAGTHIDYASVVSVTPITRVVHIPNQRQECWNEQVTTQAPTSNSYTPTLLGGLLGGVVGNQMGGGHGKTAMTVAGALIGGSIGNDVGRQNTQVVTGEQTRCRMIDNGVNEERVEAYNVTYQYDGVTYTTRMSYNPGAQIRVQVHTTVSPLLGP